MTNVRIPFASLTPREDGEAVRAAIDRVVRSGWYVLGPEVEAFEREFAEASGAAHAVGVGTGTDAIALALRGLGIGPGDEVVTTPLSAAYSALAIVISVGRKQSRRHVGRHVDVVERVRRVRRAVRIIRPAVAGDLV